MRRAIRYDQFSASRLHTLLTCPLQFDFSYVRKEPTTHNVWKVFGIMLHRYFEEFFTKRWNRRDSFIKSAMHFWEGIVQGEHGPDGFGDDPIEVNWRGMDEKKRGMFFGMIRGMLGCFWDNNIAYRHGERPAPLVEIGFKISSGGILITGWLDRIQPLEAGHPKEVPAEVWDYKPSGFSPVKELMDLQFTIYTMAFRALYGRDPAGLKVYKYKEAGPEFLQTLPPRTEVHFAQLHQFLFEARTYVEAIVRGRQPSTPVTFQFFNAHDISTGQCGARPPIGTGAHCGQCEFQTPCRNAHEKGLEPTREYLAHLGRPHNPAQISLFGHNESPRMRLILDHFVHQEGERPRNEQLGFAVALRKPQRKSKPKKKTLPAPSTPQVEPRTEDDACGCIPLNPQVAQGTVSTPQVAPGTEDDVPF